MIRTNQTFIAAIDFDFKNYDDNRRTQEKFTDTNNHTQMIKDIAETYGVNGTVEYNTKYGTISVIFSTEKKYQESDVHQAAKDFEVYLKSTGLFYI